MASNVLALRLYVAPRIPAASHICPLVKSSHRSCNVIFLIPTTHHYLEHRLVASLLGIILLSHHITSPRHLTLHNITMHTYITLHPLSSRLITTPHRFAPRRVAPPHVITCSHYCRSTTYLIQSHHLLLLSYIIITSLYSFTYPSLHQALHSYSPGYHLRCSASSSASRCFCASPVVAAPRQSLLLLACHCCAFAYPSRRLHPLTFPHTASSHSSHPINATHQTFLHFITSHRRNASLHIASYHLLSSYYSGVSHPLTSHHMSSVTLTSRPICYVGISHKACCSITASCATVRIPSHQLVTPRRLT